MTQNEFSKRYEKLPIHIFDDSSYASSLVAEAILQRIASKAQDGLPAVIAFSTSSALIQVYEALIKFHREQKLSFKNVQAFVVDEYYPIAPNDLQSHYRFMCEYLFDQVDIPKSNIFYPDGSLPKDKEY